MTLRQRVDELTETYLNDSERSIGEFVLREKGQIRVYSTHQIAQQTYTSISAHPIHTS
jgi:DNA-binding MurR/RpiR family transcriptional regulator